LSWTILEKESMKMPKMTVQEVLDEWMSKRRRMGCVAAAAWAAKRLEGFKPLRITRYTPEGEVYEHVVAFNGKVVVDLTPYADAPSGKTGPLFAILTTTVATEIFHPFVLSRDVLPSIKPWIIGGSASLVKLRKDLLLRRSGT